MPFRTVIVDDEQPICDEIEYLLKSHIDMEVTQKFCNSMDALTYLAKNDCDLLFLDIKMPQMTGLELVQKLDVLRQPPLVIFLTAFHEHALEAFNTLAVGYITKPVTQAKITKVLHKIRLLSTRETGEISPVSRICAIEKGNLVPIDKKAIVLAYVKDKDVFIRTKEKELPVALTLQEVEATLNDGSFMRVHRQYIINLDFIAEVVPWFHGSFLLRMSDCKHEEVPVSRNKVKALKTVLGIR
ncbi:MAG: LytTR family DNA-binding domain-containing protein [Sporomusaceae bacterium]|nr:LytTR family DNA-binding domain-containing protein [Sporomusaceae bacterium]